MAFSIFGKKPDKKPEKPPIKARQSPAAPGARSPGPAASEDEGESLDFTNYVPPSGSPPSVAPSSAPSIAPQSIAPPAPKPAASVAVPAGLDFGSLAAAAAPQQAPTPAPKPPPPPVSVIPDLPGLGAPASKAPEKPADAKKKAAKKPVDSILCIEVDEGGHEVPPAIEEAAVLYANGQSAEAHARLKKALEGEDLGAWKLQVWLMLFDVLQQLGRKQEFEERALDFVVKLERSPPVWTDAPSAPKQNPSLRTGGAASVSLTGALGAQSAGALEQLRKAADTAAEAAARLRQAAGHRAGGLQAAARDAEVLQDGEEGRLAHRRGDAPQAAARRCEGGRQVGRHEHRGCCCSISTRCSGCRTNSKKLRSTTP